MDVSLRHWPIFVTGLLLGAAGTMSLGLQRPTPGELAAVAPAVTKPAVAVAAAAAASTATVAQFQPDIGGAERADEQMRAAAEAFRAQEAVAAAAAPVVAQAQLAKPRFRRVVKEAPADASAAPVAAAQATAIGSTAAAAPFEPGARRRSAASVMGGAPARRSEPVEAVQERVEAARGSAHAPDGGETRPQSD